MATPSPNTESPLPAEAVYDAIGPAYQDAYAGVADKLAASVQWTLQALLTPSAPPHPAKILDIGCGTGVPVCRLLADAGHDVLGIDISAAMLAAARERVPHANAHFEKCDIRDFDRPDGSFDAASAYFSLIMGLSQEEIRGAWRKVFGLLKGGGVFVFVTCPLEGFDNAQFRWMGQPCFGSGFGKEETVRELEGVGFVVEKWEVSRFRHRGGELGVCGEEEVGEEEDLFVFCRKPVVLL